MSRRLSAYRPGASALLQIAARAQHIERWKLPRDTFPEGRRGYLRWRTTLAAHHADRATELMRAAGYDESEAATVAALLRKEGLADAPPDADVQVLEDVACLVFVEYYLGDFAANRSDEKVAEILQKTLKKMSARGRAAAGELLPPDQTAPPPANDQVG